MPDGVSAFYRRAASLTEWRKNGYYIVETYTSRVTTIRTSTSDIGPVLLSEAEWLLDHAAEQRASVKMALDADWFSPAWLLVTIYYWSYFNAVCLTRLFGRTTWFLDDDALVAFSTLALSSAGKAKPGTFRAEVVVSTTTTDCQLILQACGKRPHEAAWIELFKLVRLMAASANMNANLEEYRLWNCFKRAAETLGEDWPSQVRNRVNYQVGIAYREVAGIDQLKLRSFISSIGVLNLSEYLDHFEAEISRANSTSTNRKDLNILTKLVYLNALGLARLAEMLNQDLISKVSRDERWSKRRDTWLKSRCATTDTGVWPFPVCPTSRF